MARHAVSRATLVRGLITAVAVPMLAGSATGCSGAGSPAAGNALVNEGGVSIGTKAQQPGGEIGMLYLPLINRTRAPLRITSVSFTGRGIGTVIKVVQVSLAPASHGGNDPKLLFSSVPLSTYGTDPPIARYGPGLRCHRQILMQVNGYRLTFNANARVWVVIRNLRPGRWTITSQVIAYTQNGTSYRQAISLQAYGIVARHAIFTLDPNTQVCLKQTGARALPGWRA